LNSNSTENIETVVIMSSALIWELVKVSLQARPSENLERIPPLSDSSVLPVM